MRWRISVISVLLVCSYNDNLPKLNKSATCGIYNNNTSIIIVLFALNLCSEALNNNSVYIHIMPPFCQHISTYSIHFANEC
jgi:hypothetical protein